MTTFKTLPLPSGHFVYHLKQDGGVVYVGYTSNLLARIGTHLVRLAGKFDDVKFTVYEDAKAARAAELNDIARLDPALNVKKRAIKKTAGAAVRSTGRTGKPTTLYLNTEICAHGYELVEQGDAKSLSKLVEKLIERAYANKRRKGGSR